MIVAVEIVVGDQPPADILAAAEALEAACRSRGFAVQRLAAPTTLDNRLCLYLATAQGGYPLDALLDRGVRRDAFVRLDHTQFLVRSWLAAARRHIALAAKSGPALLNAARLVATRIAAQQDFSHLDIQGPQHAPERD